MKPEVKHFRKTVPSMQAAAGTWAREFVDLLRQPSGVNLEKHLEDYRQLRDEAN